MTRHVSEKKKNVFFLVERQNLCTENTIATGCIGVSVARALTSVCQVHQATKKRRISPKLLIRPVEYNESSCYIVKRYAINKYIDCIFCVTIYCMYMLYAHIYKYTAYVYVYMCNTTVCLCVLLNVFCVSCLLSGASAEYSMTSGWSLASPWIKLMSMHSTRMAAGISSNAPCPTTKLRRLRAKHGLLAQCSQAKRLHTLHLPAV